MFLFCFILLLYRQLYGVKVMFSSCGENEWCRWERSEELYMNLFYGSYSYGTATPSIFTGTFAWDKQWLHRAHRERERENERNYESMQQVMCYTNKVGYKHILERQLSKHEQEEKSCHEHNRVATWGKKDRRNLSRYGDLWSTRKQK